MHTGLERPFKGNNSNQSKLIFIIDVYLFTQEVSTVGFQPLKVFNLENFSYAYLQC